MAVRAIVVLLVLPVAANVSVQQHVAVAPQAAAGPITMLAGDIGSVSLGASKHSATVTLTLPLVANDIIKLQSTSSAWQVQAQFVSQSSYTGPTETITISLSDGVVVQSQVTVTAGVVIKSIGTPVDLPTGTPAEVRISGLGTGMMTFHLVVTPDAGGPAIRYSIQVTS